MLTNLLVPNLPSSQLKGLVKLETELQCEARCSVSVVELPRLAPDKLLPAGLLTYE